MKYMKDKNNTKELQEEISTLLSRSEMWLAIRMDNKGNVHLHTPSEDHLCLLSMFLQAHPEINEAVQEHIKELNLNED